MQNDLTNACLHLQGNSRSAIDLFCIVLGSRPPVLVDLVDLESELVQRAQSANGVLLAVPRSMEFVIVHLHSCFVSVTGNLNSNKIEQPRLHKRLTYNGISDLNDQYQSTWRCWCTQRDQSLSQCYPDQDSDQSGAARCYEAHKRTRPCSLFALEGIDSKVVSHF